ncbi:MAG: glycoside hydrolase family 9 protein [Puniceicoccaceae bacterium]
MYKLSYSQLGYRPGSQKLLSLVVDPEKSGELPGKIPFYVRNLFDRIPRENTHPKGWDGSFFNWPFDLTKGKLLPEQANIQYQGELVRQDTRWGTFWQGSFDAFQGSGQFQVETDYACSFPFLISDNLYDRLQYGYLNYLYCQRSGFMNPGLREATHLDDGKLDTTDEHINAVGGWYDAGDYRKWMFLTHPNMETLAQLMERGHPGLREKILSEIEWGNKFFHSMITAEGQVWEDLGGGTLKPGLDYDKDWWFENHPGCNCYESEEERSIRTNYNPSVQFMFVRIQAYLAKVLEGSASEKCLELARRAWEYGIKRGHDRRTLFVSEQLWAAINLKDVCPEAVDNTVIEALVRELISLQDSGDDGLYGYFMEKDESDGFRCIAMACEPVMALLRLVELNPAELKASVDAAKDSVRRYIDGFVLADAKSNSFSYPPYGVYVNPENKELQTFRDAGRGRFVRSFLHPLNSQQIAHGCGGVALHQAVVCAKAGNLMSETGWQDQAERIIQWTLGHNPQALCMHSGVGHRFPTPFSQYVLRLPDTLSVGHNGRPDDTPYVEESELIEWCTQEIWDIPHGYLAQAVLWV